MSYDETLAQRIRQRLSVLPRVSEKKMMGGLVFMYNDKMCAGIFQDKLMCRIDPDLQPELLKKKGASLMEFGGRKMNGYLVISEAGLKSATDFELWIGRCLDFNSKARSSKKKK